MTIQELNLYKDDVKEKIVSYDKDITKLKRDIEDLEEKNEHGLLSKVSKSVKEHRSRRLSNLNKKLNILELKLETLKFDNLKNPVEEPDTDTVDYFEYQNSLLNNMIKKQQIKKEIAHNPISKHLASRSIKKLNKQIYKNDLNIRNLQRDAEDVKAKEFDENLALQKFNESKQENKKEKENRSKISKTSDIDTSSGSAEKSKNSDSIDTVTSINYNTLTPESMGDLTKLIALNTKIYETLKKISDNQIDEQDTSIKTSDIEKEEPELVSQKDEKPVKKDNLLSKLLGFASMLFGMGINAPKMLFSYMLKAVKDSLKFFLRPFLKPMQLAIKGIKTILSPIVKIVQKMAKYVFGGLTKTLEKLGLKSAVKTSEKIGVKSASKLGAEEAVKTSEKIGV